MIPINRRDIDNFVFQHIFETIAVRITEQKKEHKYEIIEGQ